MDKFDVLYVDNHILVVNKAAGIATQPSPTSHESLELYCKEWVRDKYQKPGNVFLHAIHRLDKPVSGIVLFARTSKALSRLNESMRNKAMQKVYTAEVEGVLSCNDGVLEHYLLHGDHYAHVVSKETADAKRAILRYHVKERKSASTVVEVHLETGRYHQIRAQMAATGHPIVGDSKYGSKMKFTDSAIALRHTCFTFPHPISKELLTFALE